MKRRGSDYGAPGLLRGESRGDVGTERGPGGRGAPTKSGGASAAAPDPTRSGGKHTEKSADEEPSAAADPVKRNTC